MNKICNTEYFSSLKKLQGDIPLTRLRPEAAINNIVDRV